MLWLRRSKTHSCKEFPISVGHNLFHLLAWIIPRRLKNYLIQHLRYLSRKTLISGKARFMLKKLNYKVGTETMRRRLNYSSKHENYRSALKTFERSEPPSPIWALIMCK